MKSHSGLTHAEIAHALGLSRQMVQQIERSGLLKLRLAFGSDYRGPHTIDDREGIPDPTDSRDYAAIASQRRRVGGRFTSG